MRLDDVVKLFQVLFVDLHAVVASPAPLVDLASQQETVRTVPPPGWLTRVLCDSQQCGRAPRVPGRTVLVPTRTVGSRHNPGLRRHRRVRGESQVRGPEVATVDVGP